MQALRTLPKAHPPGSHWELPEEMRAFIERRNLIEWWLGQNPLDVYHGRPQRSIELLMLLAEQDAT